MQSADQSDDYLSDNTVVGDFTSLNDSGKKSPTPCALDTDHPTSISGVTHLDDTAATGGESTADLTKVNLGGVEPNGADSNTFEDLAENRLKVWVKLGCFAKFYSMQRCTTVHDEDRQYVGI